MFLKSFQKMSRNYFFAKFFFSQFCLRWNFGQTRAFLSIRRAQKFTLGGLTFFSNRPALKKILDLFENSRGFEFNHFGQSFNWLHIVVDSKNCFQSYGACKILNQVLVPFLSFKETFWTDIQKSKKKRALETFQLFN